MSDLVDPTQIEAIVGCRRQPNEHVARGVTADERVYILHSAACVERNADLRTCAFSKALGRRIVWLQPDVPVIVRVLVGQMCSVGPVPDSWRLEAS